MAYPENKSFETGMYVSLSTLVFINLIGNTLVILVILTNRKMKSPMNYLLANLAVADIMVGAFIVPPLISKQFFTHPEGIAGAIACKVLTGGSLTWVGSAASAFSLVAISFERYFAVIHPHSTKLRLTFRKVKRVVKGSWTFALVINLPSFATLAYDKNINLCVEEWPEQQIGSAYGTLWFLAVGVLPITIMFGLYSRVVYTLWFKRSKNQVPATQLSILKSRKRLTKMIFTVSIIYAICWLPDLTIYLLHLYNVTFGYAGLPNVIGVILVTCNSAVNPFVYTFQSEKFRRHLKQLVLCRKYRRNRVANAILTIFLETGATPL
ncbi:neuropeptide FF receptor 2-like [Actinia tenebrosa]|uniref:Neuropeptide FF receptor 2-like n=1 Tax=Actinia tenebrosa TaxID=6105 RepID=A0A6P8J5C7_ACTTE|nr:neuropeptide FF receptor 2-like [Actinia tenebrosa]